MLSAQRREKLKHRANILWGQTWWLRSQCISRLIKDQARTFLTEHQNEMIFVMGSGRSGTQLLSDLLDSSGKAKVFHEPNFWEDVGAIDTFRRNAKLAERYWKDFRIPEVYKRWAAKPKTEMYGEVNGTIRFQTSAIKSMGLK